MSNFRTFASFQSPAFRLYFLGMAGQWAASSMQVVVQALLIYRLTGSSTILGLMALATAIPQVMLTLFAGVLADRFSKKKLIQVSQAVMAVSMLGVGLALTTHYLSTEHAGSWWLLMAVAVLQGVFNALILPARQAIIPELVSKDRVLNAMSLSNMGMNVFQFIAAGIGGFLSDAINFQTVYYIMGGLCVLAIIFTGFVPDAGKPAPGRRNMMADVIEGLKYLGSRRTLLLVAVFTLICILVGNPISTIAAIFADSILKVGGTGLGILQSVSGVGALIASLVLASIPEKKRGLIMLLSGLCMGVSVLIFSFSRLWPLSIAMMLLSGVGRVGHIMTGLTLLQTHTDKEYQGRVQSVPMLSLGFGGVATFFIGVLTESIGVQWAMGGFALALTLVSVVSLLFVPRLRKLD
jgi:MFS family permease